MDCIYLDNAATTRISQEVLEAMAPYLREDFGNPGATYSLGRRASAAIEAAREQVAALIGANADDIIFTSGGSASNNLAIKGVRDTLKLYGRKGLLISEVEHDSVINAAESMRDEGFSVNYIPAHKPTGVILSDSVVENIMLDTGLVSVMYVNNETGVENPVADIGKAMHERGLLFHTDCVQAAGCHDIDVETLNCDFLSISSHKIHGPKGMGALYAKDISILKPLISGGAAQEFGLWGGTENVPGVVGFGKACEIALRDLEKTKESIYECKKEFFGSLIHNMRELNIPESICHINGMWDEGKTLNLRFDGVDGMSLLLALDACGVYVSAGSACRSHTSEPSRVLLAAGLSPEQARNSIRISFSSQNSLEDSTNAAMRFANAIKILRS